LKQILVNLLANGVKFTPTGGRVMVRCRVDGDSVVIDVTDNGYGIPDDKLPDIFGPYVQLEAPKARHFGGSGLGLAISREFAQGMGGTLTAASQMGRGSVFSLRVPRAPAETRPWITARNRIRRALS
jgi:signal transduction histidine kinase